MKILKNIFDCNINPTNLSSIINKTDDVLMKLVTSFENNDDKVLTTIEEIGFSKIYNNLSGDKLSKFFVWIGMQLVNTNHILPVQNLDALKPDGTIKNASTLLQLESNLFQFDNFSAKISNKTNIKVGTKNVPYNQMVLVYVSDDFTFIEQQFKKGDVLVMPMIQAFAMSNNNRNIVAEKSAWLAVDVLSFAVGVGEIKVFFTVGNYIRKGIVISDLVGTALLFTQHFYKNSFHLWKIY